MDDRRNERREGLRRKLSEAPEGTLALLYELMDAAHADFGTTTRSLFKQLCEESGIAFEHSDLGSTSESRPSTPVERLPSPSPGQQRVMEKAADDHYDRNLKRSVLQLWRDKAVSIRDMEEYAESHYDRRLRQRVWTMMRQKTYEQDHDELARRLELFVKWREDRLIERCLRGWILRHRENSLNKFQNALAAQSVLQTWHHKTSHAKQQEMRAEDARDYMAASSAMTLWRNKAGHLRGIRQFKILYLRLKFFQIWHAKAKQSSQARYEELLKDRYRDVKQRLGMRSARKVLDVWRDKTLEMQDKERIADSHFTRTQESNIREMTHSALKMMYISTTASLENEHIADAHHQTHLLQRLQILEPQGPWRRSVNEIQAMEARADEYRDIKTQEGARDALRSMRNQSTRTRQMEVQADEFQERHGRRRAQGYLATWREKTGEKRGVIVDERRGWDVAPATPAARRDRLLRGVKQ